MYNLPEETRTLTRTEENPFVAKFEQFFKERYLKKIEALAEHYPQKRSLLVDFKDIERFDYQLADELLLNPDYLIEASELALEQIEVPLIEAEQEFKPHVRFFNLPRDEQPRLRDISAQHINRLIAVEGVVKQMTDVLPKLNTATFECKRCGNRYKIAQSGQTIRQPAMCECKHHDFRLVSEQSEFIDHQKIQIQEPLELLKGAEQATNLDIHVADDFVNKLAPGDRTRITGILRLTSSNERKVVFGRYIEAVHVEETEREFDEVEISKEEEKEIKKLAERNDIYEVLVKSIAPQIYGHEIVKEAIALQLFGGVRKRLPGDNTIRGNIHVLLVGDPGLAKSAMLQAVDKIAPKSIYVAGKTTTGAGLSATAVKDEFGEGGWTLKAGALVLANGGLCMVDELDKMEDTDRSALHEALEQMTISVAKAGIITRFKADTSVLAAANPKFARFDPYMNYLEQVDLPVTLISRFDLLFLIRDVLDRKKDEAIATHILKTHQAGEMMLQEKMGKIAVRRKEVAEMEKAVAPAIDIKLLKKYIAYSRQNFFPALSTEAIKAISDFYLDLREQGKREGGYAATHRQLEALVRLSEASARVRLRDVVELEDAERAIRLLKTSLQEVVTDVETGKIDIDLITVGTTHTQLTNLKHILSIVKRKAGEVDMVPREEIFEEAATEGIDKEKVFDLLSKLKKAGDIYEPRSGFYKPTQK